jgi:hypothetical protein
VCYNVVYEFESGSKGSERTGGWVVMEISREVVEQLPHQLWYY